MTEVLLQNVVTVAALLLAVFTTVVYQRRWQHRRTVLPANDRHTSLPAGITVSVVSEFLHNPRR